MCAGFINKRRFPRANYPCKVVILDNDSREVFNTHTENIGEAGICVILPKALPKFCCVEVLLYLKDGKAPLNCGGKIVWVAKVDSEFDTGIEFDQLKKSDSLRIKKVIDQCLLE